MPTIACMNRLKQHRIRLGLTQAELAKRVGISRHRLSDYENGRKLPGEKMRNQLAAQFPDAPDLLATVEELPVPVRRLFTRLEPWPRTPDYRKVWGRMRTVHRALLQTLGPVEVPLLFESSIRCDSTYEPLCIVQLIHAGARPYVSSPNCIGFDLHPIVDDFNHSAGARLMPCVYWTIGNVHILIWFQVTLRPQQVLFRVDMLLLVVVGRKRFWFVVEVDGPAHNPYKDDLEKQQIGMEIIRVPGHHVTGLNFVEFLKAQLQQHGVPFK